MTTPGDRPEPDENSDYSAPQDDEELQEIHESIIREKTEPREGREPLPTWLMILFFLIVFAGGLYLGTHSGGFRGDVFELPPDTADAFPDGNDPLIAGKRLFQIHCANCHQVGGFGISGKYPPLAGSEIVLGKKGWGPNHLVKIVLNGLAGPIEVKGVSFSYIEGMPAHREYLHDEQIAQILTYIRQQWGNQAGPITSEGVAAMRAESGERVQPWTEGELKAIPAKKLPEKPLPPAIK